MVGRTTTTAVVPSLGCLLAEPALVQAELMETARQQFQPIPSSPPTLPGNAATEAKVDLG